jgi:CheY-like chemotaxis protein
MAQRILLVDDQPQNLRLLEGLLGPYGYVIQAVASGKEALRASADDPPDLVLLDVVMPEMSGYESVAASARTRQRASCRS